MGSPTVQLRCPACGQELRAVLAPSPPTQWFPCPSCHAPVPVVIPRDPPPLFSWEVFPGLYPALPRPRPPRWRAQGVTAVALFAIVVLAVAFGGILVYYGLVAAEPANYSVTGTVYAEGAGGTVSPVAGAEVVLTDEQGQRSTTTTGLDGAFAFAGVSSGEIVLNASLPGYAPTEVDTFASPVYNAGTDGLQITLVPGGLGNASTVSLSAFPDLETLLASVGGGAVLFGVVAVVALIAGVLTVRSDRPALGVVGGGAGLSAPLLLFFLGLGSIFPYLLAGTSLLAAFGAFALGVRAVELAQTGPTHGS